MAEQKGTGKHPHKDTEEPYPHHESSTTQGQKTRAAAAGAQERSEQSTSEASDLKEREYRDAQGEIHHHTKSYMDEHKGEK